MKHEKTKCILQSFSESKLANWYCPKCRDSFQCGNENTKEMYCDGIGK